MCIVFTLILTYLSLLSIQLTNFYHNFIFIVNYSPITIKYIQQHKIVQFFSKIVLYCQSACYIILLIILKYIYVIFTNSNSKGNDNISNKIIVSGEFSGSINFAMQQNYVPLIKHLFVNNNSDEMQDNLKLKITFEPDFAIVSSSFFSISSDFFRL